MASAHDVAAAGAIDTDAALPPPPGHGRVRGELVLPLVRESLDALLAAEHDGYPWDEQGSDDAAGPAVAAPTVAEPAVAEPAVAAPAVAEPADAEPAVIPAVGEKRMSGGGVARRCDIRGCGRTFASGNELFKHLEDDHETQRAAVTNVRGSRGAPRRPQPRPRPKPPAGPRPKPPAGPPPQRQTHLPPPRLEPPPPTPPLVFGPRPPPARQQGGGEQRPATMPGL